MPGALVPHLRHRRPALVRRPGDEGEPKTDEPSLTQSQHGSPVPTLAAMLWKMSLMCGLQNRHIHRGVTDPVTAPLGKPHKRRWNLTRPPCVPPAWARGHNAPLPLHRWRRCQQTAALSVSGSCSAAKWQKDGSCLRRCSVVRVHPRRAFVSPTVVSLYSELPPSMMMSPASRRGTWGTERGADRLRQRSTPGILAVRWRTGNPPVYQWSRPPPAQLWPAGWSSWVSSAWTPSPPETLLRSLWNLSPHSAESRAPLTQFDCRRRPVDRQRIAD